MGDKGGAITDKGCFYAKHETEFYRYDMDQLKSMVANANPKTVGDVAEGWKWMHDTLVGSDGSGGLRKEFDDAIDEVLEHWRGKAAEGFRKAAKAISENIRNSGPYASNMHQVMGGVETSLRDYQKKVGDMQKPTAGESGSDAIGNGALKVVTLGAKGGRDDSKANLDLATGKSTEDVLNDHAEELSEGKERQLQTAIIMEYLGSSYKSNVAAIGKPPGGGLGEKDVPPRDDTPAPPPFVPMPDSVMNPPKGSSHSKLPGANGGGYTSPGALEGPRHDGVSGGFANTPPAKSAHMPSIGSGGTAGLDSFPSGGGNSNLGPSTTGPGGGGANIPTNGSHGPSGPGTGPGMPGVPGTQMGGRGGTGPGGARAGRTGMPGMGGMAGGRPGGAGAKGAGAGRGGGLARQKGGVVGAAGGKAGSGSQGGSGLHRSRGGSQTGGAGGRRPMGMAGAPGAHGAKDKDKGENGERPDYLVEDEETWTPERNVAPKVIE
ncbi:hypothetical protein AB0D04_33860 [Streptomyces sp. NPDC048483]|uniref:hypothetical protein n=1 Tax=Streptomyces sp. NPDC048483 TaxID=3154927 RepID=UPI003412E72A